jgi:diguanylate cyclase (GGDEF)-like protein
MPALLVGYGLLAALAIYGLWSMRRRRLQRAESAQRLQVQVRDRKSGIAEQPEEANLTDPLTGLGNRRFLQHMLTRFASGAGVSRPGPDAPVPSMMLMVVHLDFLKPINDVHGHQDGDRILTQVAEILRDCCRAGDYAARWRGDEFVIAYLHADLRGAEALAERLRSRIAKQSFRLSDGRVARTSCSIGFARYPFVLEAPALLSWQQCLDMADAALSHAKKRRNTWLGWAGNAAARVEDLQRAVQTDPGILESDGRFDVRRPQFESEDTVDHLRVAAGSGGD